MANQAFAEFWVQTKILPIRPSFTAVSVPIMLRMAQFPHVLKDHPAQKVPKVPPDRKAKSVSMVKTEHPDNREYRVKLAPPVHLAKTVQMVNQV